MAARHESRIRGSYTVVGKPVPRVDLLDKFTRKYIFVSDIVSSRNASRTRCARQWRGHRSARPRTRPSSHSTTRQRARSLGTCRQCNKGNFVGVVATTEWAAIQAAKTLKVNWTRRCGARFGLDPGEPAGGTHESRQPILRHQHAGDGRQHPAGFTLGRPQLKLHPGRITLHTKCTVRWGRRAQWPR